ncbi:1,4-dihydroxy-6-naphtoate synthase [Pontiella desulfatans]|uniref:1,4-dihydroxy-6-naphtoate synthase n=1 Tax=Pontiella desulfatans TaxID=2750659 RepID=A0A6C2U895_PONDE|nr:1,4-dihydroxy-6-naphthoate synthase [Pontiella desulfatans]VGO16175.1 1,4-dihydroxy-6-naphtoate synthase [Pontiella desulfatans]
MNGTPITIGYSPCPNDTFIFCQLAKEPDIETHLHDVETLNQWAFEGKFDVTKLSFHAWLLVQDEYELLNVGAALGRGCGPLVIARKGAEAFGGGAEAHLRKCACVAVPGEYTTAHLLLRLWMPEIQNRIFMPFNQIMGAVESGEADAGVIIHEGRFVYKERGFECVQDLGEWWEETTGLPIPLGCIAARKGLAAEIEPRLRRSIHAAFEDPGSTRDYVRQHAQELAEDVTSEHIKTYVNDFTLDLGDEGRTAIRVLQQRARDAGVIQ